MLLYVPTVMHSGTTLLMNIVGANDYWKSREARAANREIIQEHVDSLYTRTRVHEADMVISSLRHPRRIAESFQRRHLELTDFMNQYRALMEDYHPFIDMYVCVDHVNRYEQARDVQEYVNNTHLISWEPCIRNGAVHKTHDTPVNLCPEVPDEFISFYEEQTYV